MVQSAFAMQQNVVQKQEVKHHLIMAMTNNSKKARGRLIWGVVYLVAAILVLVSLIHEQDTMRIGFRALILVLFLVRVFEHFRAWSRLSNEPDQDEILP